jgi:hypothetical protein
MPHAAIRWKGLISFSSSPNKPNFSVEREQTQIRWCLILFSKPIELH